MQILQPEAQVFLIGRCLPWKLGVLLTAGAELID